MPGALVISLDFELMWGGRDYRTPESYGDAILGGRKAIPEILRRFSQAGIRATWATVGLLFARDRDEMLDYAPTQRPTYINPQLSPYHAIEHDIGQDESSDPLHYGRSLVDRIRDTEGQEIATHTYSHYYCMEEGQTLEQFDADIGAACAIAAAGGITLKSIVFPRNQSSTDCVATCSRHGVSNWRGNPRYAIYAPRHRASETYLLRGLKLVDSVVPISGDLSFCHPTQSGGALDIPASRFLRPFSPNMPHLSTLQLRRILWEMRRAAETERCYHLWWHPHNFGRNTDENLSALDQVIVAYSRLAATFGMKSLNMSDFGAR